MLIKVDREVDKGLEGVFFKFLDFIIFCFLDFIIVFNVVVNGFRLGVKNFEFIIRVSFKFVFLSFLYRSKIFSLGVKILIDWFRLVFRVKLVSFKIGFLEFEL